MTKEKEYIKDWISNTSFFDIVKRIVTKGVIVEIGAGTGETTIELLKIAKEKGTKVIVIDPFSDEMPASYQYNYKQFVERTLPYKDHLILHRVNSLSHEAEILLSQLEIDFVFIDGLQYKGAVLNDLRITQHAKLVCLDDYDREDAKSQVPEALKLYSKYSPQTLFVKSRHAYLI